MAFVAGQTLTAAQLNDLDIDSLVVDTTSLVVDKRRTTGSVLRARRRRGSARDSIQLHSRQLWVAWLR